MSSLKAFAAKLSKTLVLYGGWGLFAIAFIDSAGLSMPGVKDFLLIYLCAKRPDLAWLYASGAALATALGTLVIYGVGRTGARVFGKKPSRENLNRASRWLRRNDFVTVLVASLLPPPLPWREAEFSPGPGAIPHFWQPSCQGTASLDSHPPRKRKSHGPCASVRSVPCDNWRGYCCCRP